MKIRSHCKLITASIFSLALQNCSISNYNQQIKRSETAMLEHRMPLLASRQLVSEVNKFGNEKYLFMMEAGYLLHTAGRWEDSNRLLLDADLSLDAQYRSRIQETGVIFLNDLSRDYIGEDYERVLINMTTGLNFMKLEKWEEAMVEFRKVNEKLTLINEKSGQQYQQIIMAKYLASVAARHLKDYEYAQIELKQIEEIEPGIPFVVASLLDTFEKLGFKDEYTALRRKYPRVQSSKASEGSSEFVVIFQPGLAPIKQTRGLLVGRKPTGEEEAKRAEAEQQSTSELQALTKRERELRKEYSELWPLTRSSDMEINRNATSELSDVSRELTRIETQKHALETRRLNRGSMGYDIGVTEMLKRTEDPIPKFEKRPYEVKSMVAEVYDGKRLVAKLDPVQLTDVENVMAEHFEAYYKANAPRLLDRVVSKMQAARIAGYISLRGGFELLTAGGKDKDPRAAAVLAPIGLTMMLMSPFISSIFANAALGVEKPDLRSWHSLPANYQAATTRLKPGKYRIVTKYYDAQKKLRWESFTEDFEIKPGQPEIFLSRTIE